MVPNGHFKLEIEAMGYDIIGDVHGHADKLEGLLTALGYRWTGGAWRHPERTAVFVGDLIDRGPGQIRTLELVRAMTDARSARVVMGNHEFNAIGWATPDQRETGDHLRTRSGSKGQKNRRQHAVFLSEVGEGSPVHRFWIDWFLTLPLWIEEPDFRVVHACWCPAAAALVRDVIGPGARLSESDLAAAHQPGSPLRGAIDTLLKGPEVLLPGGASFADKDGHVRREIRTRWWDPKLTTYRAAYIGPPDVIIPDDPISQDAIIAIPDRPTFIGHYWFAPQIRPSPATNLVACVDYSAAKGGPLVAYRFDGERRLSAAKFLAA